ncbi:MAG: hypothetical protein OEM94_01800 [Acidimicrobiia bacterium]|nr:hypothetical protein [Acidimicrobiia bacterium]
MTDVVLKVMDSITEVMDDDLASAIFDAAVFATERSEDVYRCAEERPTESGERLLAAATAFSDPAAFSAAVDNGSFDLVEWMLECSSVTGELHPDLEQQVTQAESTLDQLG